MAGHRARWEYSHAAGFTMAFAGFGLLLASVLVETAPGSRRPAR